MNRLPEPDADARAHSDQVLKHIRCRLEQGSLSFAEYMDIVLYAPGLGYYMAGARRFGARGDFITAPEVSNLFGACLAGQCAEVLDCTGGEILELGAGSGRLAADMLRALAGLDRQPDYRILEPSAALQNQQRETLVARHGTGILERVQWLDALPQNFRGVIVANEVLDALPVERFVIDAGDVMQVHVREGPADALEDIAVPMQGAGLAAVRALESSLHAPFADGYRSELCLLVDPWMRSLQAALDAGVILLIDYGYPQREYYLPERSSGTFACHFRHHLHDDPYHYPGLQDLTAHVDFTRVADAAVDAGLELLGYTSQASLLLSLGLLELVESASGRAGGERQRVELAQSVKTLTLPSEMGERFQAIAFGKGYDREPCGFAGQDLSHRL